MVNILIFRTDRIGDLIFTCPTILTLKKHITDCKISLVTSEKNYKYAKLIINESNPKKRIFGTAAVASRCVFAGVNILRVHDVKHIYQVIKMSKSII